MITIENVNFEKKYSEIYFRQRMFEGKSILTVEIRTEVFPELVNNQIVYGEIEVKVDLPEIKKIDDLLLKNYKGKIGNINLSMNNDGIWETKSVDDFSITFEKRNGRKLEFSLMFENGKIEEEATMISLYTTSTKLEELEKHFDMSDFHEKALTKEINHRFIYRYFVK